MPALSQRVVWFALLVKRVLVSGCVKTVGLCILPFHFYFPRDVCFSLTCDCCEWVIGKQPQWSPLSWHVLTFLSFVWPWPGSRRTFPCFWPCTADTWSFQSLGYLWLSNVWGDCSFVSSMFVFMLWVLLEFINLGWLYNCWFGMCTLFCKQLPLTVREDAYPWSVCFL